MIAAGFSEGTNLGAPNFQSAKGTYQMTRSAIRIVLLSFGLTTMTAVPVGAQLAPGSRPSVPGGIYDKPYLQNYSGGIALGGYMDHELFVQPDHSTFDQHRFIPFIFASPTEYIHVTAEIEFEHGGLVKGSGTSDGEIKLEFAVMDWVISDAFGFRGGVILTPLGKLNLTHDSPLQDLTNRPPVSSQLIPTTLSESGMGVFGVLYPGDWVVGYELYVVNGFNEKIITGAGDLRVRGGRGSQKSDNNENKAVTGRLSASPMLGLDVGVSAHSGTYDPAGEHRLTIAAADWDWQRGPFQFLGEAALVNAEIPSAELRLAQTGSADITQRGLYAQANYHFGFGTIRRYPESVFTSIVRWDYVDFNADASGDDTQQATVGLNFRPVERSVVKADYRWGWSRGSGTESWSRPDKLFSFSVATYF